MDVVQMYKTKNIFYIINEDKLYYKLLNFFLEKIYIWKR